MIFNYLKNTNLSRKFFKNFNFDSEKEVPPKLIFHSKDKYYIYLFNLEHTFVTVANRISFTAKHLFITKFYLCCTIKLVEFQSLIDPYNIHDFLIYIKNYENVSYLSITYKLIRRPIHKYLQHLGHMIESKYLVPFQQNKVPPRAWCAAEMVQL